MPPKPFKPPRPSTSNLTSAKKGRPKGSTNKPNPDHISQSTPKQKSKSTNGVKKNGASKKKETERLSAASIRSLLPSLSPDTDEMSDQQSEHEDAAEESEDPFASPPPFTSTLTSTSKRKDQREQQRMEEDAHIADLDERTEKIGDELLGVILSRFFKKDAEGRGMRMSRDAVKAVGKYMDTFVREGVARAAWTGEERGTGVLEVEDLEKLAPQLLLDF